MLIRSMYDIWRRPVRLQLHGRRQGRSRTLHRVIKTISRHHCRSSFAPTPHHGYLTFDFQPLMDNLQSVTYQTFEQDPIKYRNYEEAMFRAIRDRNQDEEMCVDDPK